MIVKCGSWLGLLSVLAGCCGSVGGAGIAWGCGSLGDPPGRIGKATEEWTLAREGASLLDVRTPTLGSIQVTASESDQIQVRVVKQACSADRTGARAFLQGIRVERQRQGSRWLVQVLVPKPRMSFSQINLAIQILAPAHMRLEAQSNAGNIAVSGFRDARLTANAGNIEARGITGRLDAHTAAGNVRVTGCTGPVAVSTGGGRILIRDTSGPVKASTGGGDIDVTVAGANGTAQIDLETGAGRIDMSVPTNLSAHIVAHAGQGQVNLGSADRARYNPERTHGELILGGGRGAVRLHTGAGDIRVRLTGEDRGKKERLISLFHREQRWGFICDLMGPEASAQTRTRALTAASGGDPKALSGLRGLLDQLEQDAAAGSSRLSQNWALDLLADDPGAWIDGPLPPALRYRLGTLADHLSVDAKRLPPASRGGACYLAARFYQGAGQVTNAMAACERALRSPGDQKRARLLLGVLRWQQNRKRGVPVAVIDAMLHAEMERSHTPGASLAIVQDGHVVMAKGYGLANLEVSALATPDTVYELGSMTKQFTATAIMILVEEGKVALDGAISTYLPELPANWKSVTVRHLLAHTSGIKEYTTTPDFFATMRQDRTHEEIIRLVTGLPLDFEPGERWEYDNTGYFLLGMIIEKVSGKSFGQFLAERIFRPLGMTATRVNDYEAVLKNRASGYVWDSHGWRGCDYWSPTQTFAAGALVSSVTDIAKWDAALYTEKLLKRSSLEQTWTPARLRDGTPVRSYWGSYGFGWILINYRGHRLVAHGGSKPGFVGGISRFVDDRLTVIVLSNNAVDPGVASRIAALLLPAPRPLKAEDCPATTRLRRVLLSLAEGHIDEADFTPEALAALRPEARQAGRFYQSLGPLRAFYPVEQTGTGDLRTYRFRVVLGRTAWIQTVVLAATGKITQLQVEPA
jgi:D-alanyl-D-alanine carboxypeptidase